MNYIGTHRFKDAPLQKVANILGYDIFVPKSYYNPLSFLKKGCPLWIHIDSDVCDIYGIGEGIWYAELIKVIKQTYPKRKGHYCLHFSEIDDSIDFKRNAVYTLDDLELSAACFNQDDKIVSIITIDKENSGVIQNCPCAYISNVINNDDNALVKLGHFIFSEENIKKHPGLLISYMPKNTNDKIGDLLGMQKINNGKYYLQFE